MIKVTPPKRGFTLIELIVVIGIIGILVALTVPAVQKVRAAAARSECGNNLRQIGVAVHLFHDTQRSFPPGMRLRQKGQEAMPLSSWLVQVLPNVERQNLWVQSQQAYREARSPFKNPPHAGLATIIPSFICPADSRISQPQIAQKTKHVVGFTSYLGVEGKDYRTRDGLLYRNSHIRLTEVTDGASNTLLAGERPPSTDFQFGWWYAGAGQRFTGSADMILGVEEQNLLPVTADSCPPGAYKFAPGNFNNQCDMFHFWSPHSGGAHFLFCDGSVRFLAYDAAPIMPALASRAGGEVVALP